MNKVVVILFATILASCQKGPDPQPEPAPLREMIGTTWENKPEFGVWPYRLVLATPDTLYRIDKSDDTTKMWYNIEGDREGTPIHYKYKDGLAGNVNQVGNCFNTYITFGDIKYYFVK